MDHCDDAYIWIFGRIVNNIGIRMAPAEFCTAGQCPVVTFREVDGFFTVHLPQTHGYFLYIGRVFDIRLSVGHYWTVSVHVQGCPSVGVPLGCPIGRPKATVCLQHSSLQNRVWRLRFNPLNPPVLKSQCDRRLWWVVTAHEVSTRSDSVLGLATLTQPPPPTLPKGGVAVVVFVV